MIRTQRPHLRVASLTHAGRSGKNNEDRFAVASFNEATGKPVLFAVVSDGIGGHLGGEVAASLAVRHILEEVSGSNGIDPRQTMTGAIHAASEVIASGSARRADQAGMGATCACVWVTDRSLFTAYVGDSRIYLVRDGTIQRTTVDHTWVQEAMERGLLRPEQARDHPNVHVLRRHLGSVELPDVDFRLRLDSAEDDERAKLNQGTSLRPSDILLMCTDGLTDMLWDDEILRLITTRNTLKSAAEDLVGGANERGGHDNITVVLLAVPGAGAVEREAKGFLRTLLGT